MQDKRDELYDNLIKSGKVTEGQIGTIDQFKSSIKDESTAKRFHENLMSAGFSADEIGDSNSFYGAISSDFQSSAVPTKQDTVTQVAKSSLPIKKDVGIFGGIPYSEYQKMPGEERLQAYSKWQQDKNKEEEGRLRGANTNQVESLYADVNKEMEAISASDKVDAPAGAAFIPAGAYGVAQRYGNTKNKEKQDRYTMLESAKDLLENSQEIVAEAGRKGSTTFFGGAGRGFRDKAFDLDTWAMGITDLYKNKFIQNASQKADKGEPLSQEEQRLLDAATVNMVTQALFSSDLGRGYKAGGVTAESLPFMLEMIANPAATAGKGIGNAILRYGVKKFGMKAAEKVTGVVAKKLLGGIAKASTRVVGDVMAASAMTATSGIARTAADAISRETGQIKYGIDEEGNAEYVGMKGGVSDGEAAYKAFAGNTTENFSEMFGRYFGALGGTLAKTGPMQALRATKVGEAFSKINSSDWAKAVARFERGANYNGTFGEYGEEVVGTVLNSIFTGDQSLSELADVDQQIDTFLGVSLMGGFMSSAKALGYRTPKYEAEKKLGKAERSVAPYFGEDWNDIRMSLEEANVEDRKAYLANVLSSDMRTNEKQAMFDYVSKLTIRDAMKAGDEKLAEEGIDLNDGITQNKASVYNGYNETAKKALKYVSVGDIDDIDQQIEVGADIDYIRKFIDDKGMSKEQSEALMDYSVAKQDFNDYLNGVQSRIDREKANARQQVESVSNPDMGATVRVKSTLFKNPIHVVGGKLVFDGQGFVDEKQSDGVIDYMNENGKRKMAAPSIFESLIDSTPTEELVEQAEAEAEEMIIAQEDAELSPMEVGRIVYTPDGIQGEVTRFTAEGDPIVLSDAGEQVFKKEQLTLSAVNEQNVVSADISSGRQLESNSVPAAKESNVSELLNELPSQVSKTSFEENGKQTISESAPERTMESLLLELPKKKDGVLDYKAMTPRQTFEYTKFSEGDDTAISDLQADIIDATEELNKLESKVGKAKGAERIELREQSKVAKSRLSDLQTIMNEAVPVTAEEVKVESKQTPVMDADMLEWTADNSNDADELLSAYNQAKEMASHDSKLKPWEQSLLGRKVSTDSFMRFADRNLITGQLAKGWLSKDATSIDQISKEFEMEGIDVSDQDIVDFIIRNPSNYVRKTSDTQNKLGRRFSETASKASGMPIGSPESVTGRLFIQNMQQGKTIEGMRQAVQEQALQEDAVQEEAFFNSIPDKDAWTDEQVMEGVLDGVEYMDGEYIISDGMTLDEIDDIYTQLELDYDGRETEEANSQENEFADAFDEAREIEEPETPGVASVEDRENQKGDSGVGGLKESALTGTDVVDGERADKGIANVVLAHKEGLFEVDNSRKVTQEGNIQVSETNKIPSFVAPAINPDEDIVVYAERVVKYKDFYDEQAKVNTEPSEAQKEAGNYKMGHAKIGGHEITIENPKGSVRRGVNADGKAWETPMNNTYGYFRRTKGKDGDYVDVFLGENLNPENVYVVDQVNEDGSFDEHKVMYGFDSVEDARKAYLSNYEEGWQGLGEITGVSREVFDEWLGSGTKKQKPFAKYRIVGSVANDEFTPLKELTEENIANFAGDEVQKRMALGYLGGNRNSINTIAYENLKNRINEFNRSRLLQSNSGGTISANRVNEETVSSDSGRDGRSGGYHSEEADRSLQGRIQFNNERPGGTEAGGQSHMDGDGGNDGVRSNQSVQGITSGDVDTDTGGVKPNGRNADSGSRDSVVGGRKKTDKNVARDARKRRDRVSSLKEEKDDALNDLKRALKELRDAGGNSLSFSVVGLNAQQIEATMKVISAGSRYGYALVKEGAVTLSDWIVRMKEALSPSFKAMHFSDEEINEFIQDMWESELPDDAGIFKSVKQWAEELGMSKTKDMVRSVLDVKREKQRSAESVPTQIGDLDNIRAALPFLLEEQHDDVLKTEIRFFSDAHKTRELAFGKGMMFTNGTGTGKTYTGLGVIKRLIKQGKDNVLIVVPSQNKVTDWINDGSNLGIAISALKNTKKAGKGVVITTYANFGVNKALYGREFDLVVYDESHRLMENKDGGASSRTSQHYLISNRNEGDALRRLQKNHELWQREDAINLELKGIKISDDMMDDMLQDLYSKQDRLKEELSIINKQQKQILPELELQAKEAVKKTKVLFLSATPFKDHFNLRYAEQYLFSYPEKSKEFYNDTNPEEQFYLENFGSAYKMRYNRLEKSGENADLVSRQEIEFSQKLTELGVMSGRMINSEMDYSRDFPTVTSFNSDAFNNALNDVFDYKEDAQFETLTKSFSDVFHDYNYSTKLFEVLKTSASVGRMKEHLDSGRKIVVFHRRRQGDVMPPFKLALDSAFIQMQGLDENAEGGREKKVQMDAEIRAFKVKYSQLLKYEQTLNYLPVAEQLKDVFGDRVAVFNGSVSNSEKKNAVADFNKDDSGVDIIVIQEESGKEGISLHDQTGKHQRVLVNMALPISSITALQIEGRTYRIGNATNAIFEYPLLGLDLETYHFGSKLNKKLSTTENLAMGNLARDLLSSFANGVLEQSGDIDINSQGTGGKEYDKRATHLASSLFDKAVSAYYNIVKRSSKTKSMEGIDYFPTPEPLGLKMVEWGKGRENESFLEPSAGHGAIARWVPSTNKLTAIEPSGALFSKLNVASGGSVKSIIQGRFEDYHIVNKHDVVVMNPPFGSNSKTAADHLEKAFVHLKNGGRLVAIVPDGASMNKRLDKFLYGENEKGKLLNPTAILRGEVLLPSVSFERAGTKVIGKIVVIDKIDAESKSIQDTKRLDLRYISDVRELFDAIQDFDMPERVVVEKDISNDNPTSKAEDVSNAAHSLPIDGTAEGSLGSVEVISHTKTGEELFKVALGKRLDRNGYVLTARVADKHKGYWSKFVNGFIFKTQEQADSFVLEVNSKEGNLQQSDVDSNRPLPGESLQDFVNRINNRRIEKNKDNILDECTLISNNIKERIRAKIDISVCRDESDVYSNMERNGESDSAISKVHEAFARSKENNRKFCGFLSSLSGNVYICAEAHLNSSVHPRTSIMHETTHKVIGDNYSKGDLVEWYNEIGGSEISKYVPKHYFEEELTDDKRASLANEYFAHIIGMVSRRDEVFDNLLSGDLSFLDKLELPKIALSVINEISDLISSGYESRNFERDKREGSRSDNQPDGGRGIPEAKKDGGLEVVGSGEPGLRSGDAGELSRDRQERDDSDLTKSDVSFSEDGTPLDEILFLDAEGKDILRHVREDERSITQVIDSIRNIDRIKSNDLSKRTLGTRAAEGLFDDALKLKRLQVDVESKRGSSLDGYMNPYQFITSIPKRNEYETERFNEKFMRPIYKSMRQIKDAGAKEKDIYAYLYGKSGIERNEKMRTKAMLEYISNIKDDTLRNDLLAESTGMTISEMVFTNEDAEKKRISLLSRDYSGLTELREVLFDKEANKTEKHIQEWIEAFEHKYEVSNLWGSINLATKETLENEFRNGKIDKATKETISGMYDYYLPLRNWEGEQAKDVWEYANGDQSEGIGNVVKKAFGRKTLAGNPIVNIGLMGQQSIHSGNRNTLKQMFLSMARNNPNEAYSVSPLWIKNIGTEDSENWVETAPEWDDNPDIFAENVERFDAEMDALKKEGRAMQKYTRGSVGMPITKMEANEHQVIVSEAGKRYIVYVNTDPAISRAINGIAGKAYSVQDGKALNNDFVQKVIRANGIIMRTMGKSFTTWNPMFILNNGQRDIMNALLIASVKEGKEYAGEIAKNMFSPSVHGAIMRAVMKIPNGNNPIDKLFKEYESNGGETGFSELFKDSDFERQIKKELNKRNVNPMAVINVYLNNIEKLNRWAENVSRFSTYKASRDSGRDIYRSVYDAKEITVNFNRKGTGACGGNFLRLAYVFSGAGLQAMYQMGRLSLNNKTRKKAAVLMTSVAVAGCLIPLMNNMLLGGDSDDIEDGYDFKPEYERKSNIMVRVGKGKYAKLSIPQELRPFWNIGETLYQLTRGNINTWEAGINIGEGFAGVMPFDPFGSSGLVPTVLQPIDQARNNENFFGGKIYKDETRYNKYLPQWQRGFRNTSPIAVGLSEWLNDATGGDEATQGKIDISPGVMEHLVEGYFGGSVKFLNNVAKTTKGVVKAANGDSSFLETKNIPFLSTFYTDSSNPISKDVDRLYWDYISLSERVGTIERKYKELMNIHPDKAAYYQEKIVDLRESKDYECKTIADRYYDIVSNMTKRVNQDVLDGKSKTEDLEQIKDVKKMMLNEINNIK